MALTNAEKQAKHRAKLKAAGIERIAITIPSCLKADLFALERFLRERQVSQIAGLVIRDKATGRVSTKSLDRF